MAIKRRMYSGRWVSAYYNCFCSQVASYQHQSWTGDSSSEQNTRKWEMERYCTLLCFLEQRYFRNCSILGQTFCSKCRFDRQLEGMHISVNGFANINTSHSFIMKLNLVTQKVLAVERFATVKTIYIFIIIRIKIDKSFCCIISQVLYIDSEPLFYTVRGLDSTAEKWLLITFELLFQNYGLVSFQNMFGHLVLQSLAMQGLVNLHLAQCLILITPFRQTSHAKLKMEGWRTIIQNLQARLDHQSHHSAKCKRITLCFLLKCDNR